MWSAFALAVAPRGQRLSEHVVDVLFGHRPVEVGFPVAERVVGRDPSGALAVAAWWAEGDGASVPVGRTSSGAAVVALCGQARWGSRAWGDHSDLASVDGPPVLEHLEHRIRDTEGTFAALGFVAGSGAVVATDPLGYVPVFAGERDGTVVVATRPSLVAAAIAAPGTEAQRDLMGVVGLAHARIRLGDQTGYVGVRMLPGGTVVRADAEGGCRREQTPSLWEAAPSPSGPDRDGLITVIGEQIAAGLHAAMATDRPVVCDLTGGRDSRLVLAVAVSEGLASQCRFRTLGPPDLDDVVVAQGIAERLGLDHEVTFARSPDAVTTSHAERSLQFVARTQGMTNLWEERAAVPDGGITRVSGLFGTLARTPVGPLVDLSRRDRFVATFGRRLALGRLGLVQPEVARSLDRALAGLLVEGATDETTPLDLLHRFHLRYWMRHRTGPFQDLDQQLRVAPPYTRAAVSAAAALGGPVGRAELVHRTLIERASPELATMELAGHSWPDPSMANLPDPGAHGDVGSADMPSGEELDRLIEHWRPNERPPIAQLVRQRARRPDGPAAAGEPLMARIRRTSQDRHHPLLVEVFADEGNPAWQVIDRARAIEALAVLDHLAGRERRELFGAATAAIWLRS